MNHFIKQHQLSYKMETKQLVYKAFDIWCLKIYNKKYPPTDNNLITFIKDVTTCNPDNKFLERYLNAQMGSIFMEDINQFIKENDNS